MKYPKLSGKYLKEDYLKLHEFAKNYDHSYFLKEMQDYFGWVYDKEDMDYIGLYLQVCIKISRPLYLHGYVISSALYKYIKDQSELKNLTILETGTGRGFSSIVMAHILKQTNTEGKINTIDRADRASNCIDVPSREKIWKPRHEILERWADIRDKYINFIKGNSNAVLRRLKIGRIHFAFLDGAHHYKELSKELKFVEDNQESGDIIICDDYTAKQFPEICKAIDTFLEKNTYEHKIFYGDDGTKKRGYVYMKKK